MRIVNFLFVESSKLKKVIILLIMKDDSGVFLHSFPLDINRKANCNDGRRHWGVWSPHTQCGGDIKVPLKIKLWICGPDKILR